MRDNRFLLNSYNTPNKSHHMRADGSLTYLQFIRLLEQVWYESHPDIPFVATGGEQVGKYPCITYGLQMRKTHPNEVKPRPRENIYTDDGQDMIIISGQRFQNIIIFTAVAENEPRQAEELIEAFEDFMLEFTPVFKELGVSELVYARRLPDEEENRPAEGVNRRKVSYMVTTEKVYKTSARKLNEILIFARRWLDLDDTNSATPSTPNI